MDPNSRLTGTTLNRRSVFKAAAGLGVAALAATAFGGGIAQAGLPQYRTTANLNLRSGPGTTFGVITVVPSGTILAHMGKVSNGYYEVGYGHTYGWVSGAYLVPAGTTDPVIIGSTVTVANVNLRSGPSIYDGVLRVVPKGASVKISDTVRGGYRYVIHNGLAGWIHDSYLAQRDAPSGETFTTTARLNLRAAPSSTAAVLLVMPENATVAALAGTANGWRQVSYKGTVGWAATAYLN